MINAILLNSHWLYIGTAWNTKAESTDLTTNGRIYCRVLPQPKVSDIIV